MINLKNGIRQLALLAAFVMVFSACSQLQPGGKQPLKMTMFGTEHEGSAPGDVLTPIWREKTGIAWDFLNRSGEMTSDQWVQMQMAADTLPEIISTHELSTQAIEALINAKKLYEITEDDIRKNMPKYTDRIEKLGLPIRSYMDSNLWSDGKMYYVPYELRPHAFPALRGDIRAIRDAADAPYSLYFRDDILKKIYPNARTERELKELYVANGGALTVEEAFGDIPINNMEDLYQYLRKVKELGIKVGDKDVIPAQLTVSSNVGSTLWSLQTAMEMFWQGGFSYKDDRLIHVQSSDMYKEYIRYYSKFNAEGLIDREAWINTDDQIKSKAINGEFAVFNYWLPVTDARHLSEDEGRGYGFRMVPAFLIPLVNEYQNMVYRPISLTSAAKIFLTTSIKPADKPKVFGWLDWNFSYDADELRFWGLPEWSEGKGDQRRFKPEYAEVEQAILRGIPGEHDAAYYGLQSPATYLNIPEIHRFSLSGNFNRPFYAYPPQVSTDVSLDDVLFRVIREYYATQMTFYNQVGWTNADIDQNPEWKRANEALSSPEHAGRLANALIAAPEDFDAKFQEYYDNAYPAEFHAALGVIQEVWKNIYHNKVVPEIEKAKSGK